MLTAILGLLALVGLCGTPITLVTLVNKNIRNKPVKKTLITLGVLVAFFLIGFIGIHLV
ncbi:MAG: hypothetical protein MJ116_04360 [Lachnospiraceae bacterium]|nr:hypothetical protein [Lachnospiraceae bacterium]